jgi:hypothetical protein
MSEELLLCVRVLEKEVADLKEALGSNITYSPCCNKPMMKYPSSKEWMCHSCKTYYELGYKDNTVGEMK